MTSAQLVIRSDRATIIHAIVIMPILVANVRQVVITEVERGNSVLTHGPR